MDGRKSSAFDCSLPNVGNHWDPTAACGKLAPDGVTCEFGDLSGMAGPIDTEMDAHTHDIYQKKPHDGKAAMSASFGEIYPDTLNGRPYLSCQFETLPKMGMKRPTYDYASVWSPLDQFPKNASVLVHCGKNYANAGARFFC